MDFEIFYSEGRRDNKDRNFYRQEVRKASAGNTDDMILAQELCDNPHFLGYMLSTPSSGFLWWKFAKLLAVFLCVCLWQSWGHSQQ